MKLPCAIWLLSFLILYPAPAEDSRPVSRILFGSCLKQNDPSPIFGTMLEHRPELLLFLGDNIYADTFDMGEMEAKYAVLGAKPDFQKLRAAAPVHATWDDHDYGVNDGGAEYTPRDEAQRIFLDFWGDAADSPRRGRRGVYESAIYGEPGQRVQVLMLDTRYFRGPLKKGEKRLGGSWYPSEDPSITMLGEAQWAWLEGELKKPAEVRLVVSSIQLVASAAGQETWANLPLEQKKLYDLIAKTKANGVIVLSGDRHWAELSVEREGVPYPIRDLTSSSFNQLPERGTPTENSKRALPNTWHRENFGEVAIEWKGEETVIHLRVRDLEGKAVIEEEVALRELKVESVVKGSPETIPVKSKDDCPDYLRVVVSPVGKDGKSSAIRIEVDSEDGGISRVSGRMKVASWLIDSLVNSWYENGVHRFSYQLGPSVLEGSEMLVTARGGKVFRIALDSPDFRRRAE